MKHFLPISILLLPFALAGCGAPSSPAPSPIPTKMEDPLIQLLKEDSANTPSLSYQLEKTAFLEQAKSMNGVIIDLRMEEEIKKIPMIDPSAKNLDFYSDKTVSDFFRTADKEAVYFLYDSNGSRSENVYRALQKIGFPKAYVLKGGIGE